MRAEDLELEEELEPDEELELEFDDEDELNRKPVIGITMESKFDPSNTRNRGKLALNWNYAEAITAAGGVPIIIPPTADMEVISMLIDGWLIPGGLDIDAKEYGQENHKKAKLQDKSRFIAERNLFNEINPEMPVLGICYGCQLLNVLHKGDLVQHLPDVEGTDDHESGDEQEYNVDPSSMLGLIIGGGKMSGKSYHHQAVGRLGEGLVPIATAKDGTIEAIEAPDRFFMLGVQWHPERSFEDPNNRALLIAFVEQCRQYGLQKLMMEEEDDFEEISTEEAEDMDLVANGEEDLKN